MLQTRRPPLNTIRIFNHYVSAKVCVLMMTDVLLIPMCFLTAAKLWYWNDSRGFAALFPGFAVQCLTQMVLLQMCFYYNDMYHGKVSGSRIEKLAYLIQLAGVICTVSGLVYCFVPALMIGREVLFLALSLTLVGELMARLTWSRVSHAVAPSRNVFILGTRALASTVAREISLRRDLNMYVSAFVSQDPEEGGPNRELFGKPVVGIASLKSDVQRQDKSHIIVALDDRRGALPVTDLVRLSINGASVEYAWEFLAALDGRIRLDVGSPGWFIFEDVFRRSNATSPWKSSADFLFGVIGLIVTSPIILLTAIAIWIESGRPILYRQTRVGLSGRPFQLLKFRSMRVDAEPNGEAQWASINDARATRVGSFLRLYHLDELPQFVNVIRREMSFVGPRPERPFFVEQLRSEIPYYDERHLVRPGVTGWAQIQYRYGSSTEDAIRKLEYDLFYLKNMSFLFDCMIVFKTLRIVLRGFGG